MSPSSMYHDSLKLRATDERIVSSQLERARNQARDRNLKIGASFWFSPYTDLSDTKNAHKILFGMMNRAEEFGMQANIIMDNEIELILISDPQES